MFNKLQIPFENNFNQKQSKATPKPKPNEIINFSEEGRHVSMLKHFGVPFKRNRVEMFEQKSSYDRLY